MTCTSLEYPPPTTTTTTTTSPYPLFVSFGWSDFLIPFVQDDGNDSPYYGDLFDVYQYCGEEIEGRRIEDDIGHVNDNIKRPGLHPTVNSAVGYGCGDGEDGFAPSFSLLCDQEKPPSLSSLSCSPSSVMDVTNVSVRTKHGLERKKKTQPPHQATKVTFDSDVSVRTYGVLVSRSDQEDEDLLMQLRWEYQTSTVPIANDRQADVNDDKDDDDDENDAHFGRRSCRRSRRRRRLRRWTVEERWDLFVRLSSQSQ